MHYSLVTRLIILSTIMVLMTVVVLSSVVYYGFSNKIEHHMQQNLTEVAQFHANKINSILAFERVNLLSWRSSAMMMDVIVDDLDKRIQNELLNLKNNYQLPGHLYVFNQQGLLIASSQPNVLGQTLPDAWHLEQQDYRFIPVHSVALDTEPIVAFVVHLSTSILSRQGYLVLTHPWSDIYQQLLSEQYQFAFYHQQQQSLERVTNTGIQTFPIDKPFKQQENWFFDGQSYFAALSDRQMIGNFGLQIAAFISKDKASEPKFELLKELNIAAGIVILPIVFIVSILSRRFISPIKILTKTIQRIEQDNDLSITVSINSKDEIADLASVFNRMTANLAKAFDEREKISLELEHLNLNLEEKVKERTQELATALEQLKLAQLKLVQSEKMNSLGQLVAGIAHEINNPVGAIYANVQPLKEYVADLQEGIQLAETVLTGEGLTRFSDFLAEIDYVFLKQDLEALLKSQQQAAERIKNIILALRNFSRLDQGEVKSVILEQGIDSTLQILQHEYKARITLEKDYQLNRQVECYAGELNQVFMNILANAIQAIPDKGIIRIKTCLENEQATIQISDNGTGIPDAVKLRIFEPFFTTKEIGKGTGLGLSISYGIIEKHQGTLEVDSSLGQGTTFTIRIPLQVTKKNA